MVQVASYLIKQNFLEKFKVFFMYAWGVNVLSLLTIKQFASGNNVLT